MLHSMYFKFQIIFLVENQINGWKLFFFTQYCILNYYV